MKPLELNASAQLAPELKETKDHLQVPADKPPLFTVWQTAGGALKGGGGGGLHCEMLAMKAPGRLTHPKDHTSIWLNTRTCRRSLCIPTLPASAFPLRRLQLKRIKTKTDHKRQPED